MTFKTSKKRLLLVQFRLRRSSRSQMFFKISVLKNFALFTGKHLCWSLFLIKRETGVFLWILRNFYEQLFHRTPLAAAFFVWSMGWCLKLTRFLTTKWQNSIKILLNPFVPNAHFLYPLKASENLMVFWCFQGVQKGCIGNKRVKIVANGTTKCSRSTIDLFFLSNC